MEDHVPIFRGQPTCVWRYGGKVVKGDPGSLGFLSSGYLPVLRVRRGQKVRIDLANELPEPTNRPLAWPVRAVGHGWTPPAGRV
jgi:FtsP/CotA-like multicopper oxidase with cupredoxin domain